MTPPLSDGELIQRLLLAALLGGILGFERELRQKSAGLRTNMKQKLRHKRALRVCL